MVYFKNLLIVATIVCCLQGLSCQLLQNPHLIQNNGPELQSSFPQYMQSPIVAPVGIPSSEAKKSWNISDFRSETAQLEQRSFPAPRLGSTTVFSQGRFLAEPKAIESINRNNENLTLTTKLVDKTNSCLYDKSYFTKFDECLSRKPYPTIGLPAFKNEDLVVKQGLGEKQGCVFVLNNGLFKTFKINKYALDSDSKCLDGNKVSLALNLNNVTLSYLWTLRCLNRADQLLDDATLDGKTTLAEDAESNSKGICVGSSQSFGFTALQLSSIEARMDLSTDIFKNWRVTNVTVAMPNPTSPSIARSISGGTENGDPAPLHSTNINEYVFESLDGDELNWRYLHLFQNWTRNRMHNNFLDQFRRFLWISLQRCLSESSEQLPTKLKDVFLDQKYN